MHRFRTPISTGLVPSPAAAAGVDAVAGVIRGASAMQAVEALGHGVLIDTASLDQVCALGNAAEGGVKVRYTHPGLCGDGMGSYLGRMRNFAVVGDKVLGDIHLSDVAAASPEGNLRDYVLGLAQEDPGAFGMSVVIETSQVFRLADGSEVPAEAGQPAPDGATTALPLVRVTALHAVDVVDEPAANRDGMFGRGAALLALARGTNLDASQAFASLDSIRDQLGWDVETVNGLLGRYLAARQAPAAAISATEVRDLAGAHPAHLAAILDGAAQGLSRAAILDQIDSSQRTALAAKAEALLAKYTADLAARDAALAAAQAAHAAELAALRDRVAKAEALAAIAKGSAFDPGAGNADADRPTYTRAQAAAGSIPAALVLSGAYTLTP
jgi:hypothetical protein